MRMLYRWLMEFTFIGLILSDLFGIKELGLFDELMGILFFILALLNIFERRGKIEDKTTKYMILCMIGMGIIGLCGNFIYPIQNDYKVGLYGMYLLLKQYIFGLYLFLSAEKMVTNRLYLFFQRISKIMLFVLFVCSCLNLILDVGMRGPNGEFSFFAQFGGTVGCWIILFLAICYSDLKSNRLFWFIIATITMFQSQSDLGILGIGMLVLIHIYLEKQKHFHWYYMIPIALVGILISWKEISMYLLDSTAPRAELFIYSFVTAYRYFPIGAGFSTYASSMAVTNYSQLYYIYGFNNQFGMSKDNAYYLMDSYYPMIFGELGVLGTIVFSVMLWCILKRIIGISNRYIKNSILYLFVFLLIAGLGFGTGSSWGCAVYMLIPLKIIEGNKLQNKRQYFNVKGEKNK